jgi:hypothetical protein
MSFQSDFLPEDCFERTPHATATPWRETNTASGQNQIGQLFVPASATSIKDRGNTKQPG